MNGLKLFIASITTIFACIGANASTDISEDRVFASIAKYISVGDSELLSGCFSENIDLSLISTGGITSRDQAKQILKSFFESYTPSSFEIMHTSGRPNMRYALGQLIAGGENFLVTIFVSTKGASHRIQQLSIERR